jgi:hypothetical protein
MKLITEELNDVKYIVEATESGKKNYYITGPFMVYDEPNKNNRIYENRVMAKALGPYIKEYVEKGRAFGELGHPSGPSINLDRVSHVITELRDNGNRAWIGKAKLTETPMGQIARGLLESGCTLGVSSRGMGSLEEKNGIMYVKDDYYVATAADIVADPSAPGAFVQGIMEGVEWVMENGSWKATEAADVMRQEIKKMSVRDIQEQQLNFFKKYLNSL